MPQHKLTQREAMKMASAIFAKHLEELAYQEQLEVLSNLSDEIKEHEELRREKAEG